mmetsp:Transcript_41208/g.105374  ORF Transcript_41208/g.105374 Transcript_41208/m.105374 type:complete len:203 (-) Transcript_41208:11-619(-)
MGIKLLAMREEAARRPRVPPPPSPPPPPPPPQPPLPPMQSKDIFTGRRGLLAGLAVILGAVTAQGSRDFMDEATLSGSVLGTKWYYSRGALVVEEPDGTSYWVQNSPKYSGVLMLKDRTGPALLLYPTALREVDLKNANDLKAVFGNGVWYKQLAFVARQPFGPPVLLAPDGAQYITEDMYEPMQDAGASREEDEPRKINPR